MNVENAADKANTYADNVCRALPYIKADIDGYIEVPALEEDHKVKVVNDATRAKQIFEKAKAGIFGAHAAYDEGVEKMFIKKLDTECVIAKPHLRELQSIANSDNRAANHKNKDVKEDANKIELVRRYYEFLRKHLPESIKRQRPPRYYDVPTLSLLTVAKLADKIVKQFTTHLRVVMRDIFIKKEDDDDDDDKYEILSMESSSSNHSLIIATASKGFKMLTNKAAKTIIGPKIAGKQTGELIENVAERIEKILFGDSRSNTLVKWIIEPSPNPEKPNPEKLKQQKKALQTNFKEWLKTHTHTEIDILDNPLTNEELEDPISLELWSRRTTLMSSQDKRYLEARWQQVPLRAPTKSAETLKHVYDTEQQKDGNGNGEGEAATTPPSKPVHEHTKRQEESNGNEKEVEGEEAAWVRIVKLYLHFCKSTFATLAQLDEKKHGFKMDYYNANSMSKLTYAGLKAKLKREIPKWNYNQVSALEFVEGCFKTKEDGGRVDTGMTIERNIFITNERRRSIETWANAKSINEKSELATKIRDWLKTKGVNIDDNAYITNEELADERSLAIWKENDAATTDDDDDDDDYIRKNWSRKK